MAFMQMSNKDLQSVVSQEFDKLFLEVGISIGFSIATSLLLATFTGGLTVLKASDLYRAYKTIPIKNPNEDGFITVVGFIPFKNYSDYRDLDQSLSPETRGIIYAIKNPLNTDRRYAPALVINRTYKEFSNMVNNPDISKRSGVPSIDAHWINNFALSRGGRKKIIPDKYQSRSEESIFAHVGQSFNNLLRSVAPREVQKAITTYTQVKQAANDAYAVTQGNFQRVGVKYSRKFSSITGLGVTINGRNSKIGKVDFSHVAKGINVSKNPTLIVPYSFRAGKRRIRKIPKGGLK